MGRVIRQAGQGKIAFTVVRPRVINRSRKVTAAENPRAQIETRAVGDGLEIGIGPRLIAIG